MLHINDVGRAVVWNDGSYGLIVSAQRERAVTKFRIWWCDQTYVFQDDGKPYKQGPIMLQGGMTKLEIIGFGSAPTLKVGA